MVIRLLESIHISTSYSAPPLARYLSLPSSQKVKSVRLGSFGSWSAVARYLDCFSVCRFCRWPFDGLISSTEQLTPTAQDTTLVLSQVHL